MIQLGFVSAILADKSFEEVVSFASENGFSCVEMASWPMGKAERRYAGVTHVDADSLTPQRIREMQELLARKKVFISALAYHPNPMDSDETKRGVFISHILKVIDAAALLGIGKMNTFVGRIPSKNIDYNFDLFKDIWPPIIKHAEEKGVKVGIENCPMYFSKDEWPSGKNLAYCPANWRRMFEIIPSAHFGLNYDPSHLVWMMMDYLKPLREFKDKLFHIHIKDVKVNRDKLDDVGILATPLEFHSPRLPGLGDVNWEAFMSTLIEVGYRGPACIEVEDRNFESCEEDVRTSLRLSRNYMSRFFG